MSLEEWSHIDVKDFVRRRKETARSAARQAVRVGLIEKKPCEDCGSRDSEGHHPDYTRSLEVVWLCHKHHMALHKKANEISRYLDQIRRWKRQNEGLKNIQNAA